MTASRRRTITGYASTFNGIDAVGDTVPPGAFRAWLAKWKAGTAPVPLCNQHRYASVFDVLGKLIAAEEDSHGLLTTFEVVEQELADAFHGNDAAKIHELRGKRELLWRKGDANAQDLLWAQHVQRVAASDEAVRSLEREATDLRAAYVALGPTLEAALAACGDAWAQLEGLHERVTAMNQLAGAYTRQHPDGPAFAGIDLERVFRFEPPRVLPVFNDAAGALQVIADYREYVGTCATFRERMEHDFQRLPRPPRPLVVADGQRQTSMS